jgi:hypothetical protein
MERESPVCRHNGEPMIWLDGPHLCVYPVAWAQAYEISIEEGFDATLEHIRRLLGDIRIVWEHQEEIDLPF